MRRTRFVVVLASAAALASACNALTGASDLTADLCTGCGADASAFEAGDATSDRPIQESTETGVDGSATHPTFCLGLVLYATYDQDLASTVGSSPLSTTKDPVVAGGKFGKGLQVVGATSTAYYPMDADGGVYPERAGTLALWFKPSAALGPSVDRIFAKPIVDQTASVNETAPQLRYENASMKLGLGNQNPDGGTFVTAGLLAGNNGVPAGWNAMGFNHLVGTWNRDNASLRFWLNGGSTPDTFAESKEPWTPQTSPTGFLRLSSSVSPADGIFDELAMWSRELASTEVQQLYASPVAIADACGL